MTTPICNCPENIGWQPEANWPFGTAAKANAQPIYCVGGNPVLGPRSAFKSDYPEARVDRTPATAQTFAAGVADLRTGATIQDQTITNSSAYPMQFVAFADTIFRGTLITGTTMTFRSSIYVNGASVATKQFKVYGDTNQPLFEISVPWVYPLATLASGSSMIVAHYPTVEVDVVNAYNTWSLIGSAIRVFGGNSL